MAAISGRQPPEQTEDEEITLDAECDEAEGFLIQSNPDAHDDFLKWFACAVSLSNNQNAELEATFQAATSDLSYRPRRVTQTEMVVPCWQPKLMLSLVKRRLPKPT